MREGRLKIKMKEGQRRNKAKPKKEGVTAKEKIP